jgi:long-chain acyl-CoA synthetase
MVKTLNQLFLHNIKTFNKEALLLYKREGRYLPISSQEFAESVRSFALGLKDLGHRRGDKLAILAENGPNWFVSDFANVCIGGITVPIHTVLSPEQIKYIIQNSEARILVCSSPEIWEKIDAIRTELTNVKYFINIGDAVVEDVLNIGDVQEKGKTLDRRDPAQFEKLAMTTQPQDLAAILYTSGTTGMPKGVMLTHQNFVSNFIAGSEIIQVTEKDTGLSFLPVSHTLERIAVLAYFFNGCTIAFAESIDTLRENLLEIRPHVMVSAPRIFEKIYAGVMDNVLLSSPLKRRIFFWALDVGKKYGRRKIRNDTVPPILTLKRSLADRLVFSKIAALTGGRIRLFVSGGAPLAKDIAEFFYSLGLVILEGYGLTETSPIITLSSFDHLKFGSPGRPVPGVEVKIAEDGEILTRGPHVMKGYFKLEAETREAFDRDWLRTGDIGYLDEEGFLFITDRKKDIIVTSGGKNVAPQQIENLLKTNAYITNVMVIGDERKFISALVVPDFEKLEGYAQANEISFEDRADLVTKNEIIDFVLSEVQKSTPDLAIYEQVKKIALLDKDFEMDEGEITPTLKVKRNIIAKKYAAVIDSLYSEP